MSVTPAKSTHGNADCPSHVAMLHRLEENGVFTVQTGLGAVWLLLCLTRDICLCAHPLQEHKAVRGPLSYPSLPDRLQCSQMLTASVRKISKR